LYRNLFQQEEPGICYVVGIFAKDVKTCLLPFMDHTELVESTQNPVFTRPLEKKMI